MSTYTFLTQHSTFRRLYAVVDNHSRTGENVHIGASKFNSSNLLVNTSHCYLIFFYWSLIKVVGSTACVNDTYACSSLFYVAWCWNLWDSHLQKCQWETQFPSCFINSSLCLDYILHYTGVWLTLVFTKFQKGILCFLLNSFRQVQIVALIQMNITLKKSY